MDLTCDDITWEFIWQWMKVNQLCRIDYWSTCDWSHMQVNDLLMRLLISCSCHFFFCFFLPLFLPFSPSPLTSFSAALYPQSLLPSFLGTPPHYSSAHFVLFIPVPSSSSSHSPPPPPLLSSSVQVRAQGTGCSLAHVWEPWIVLSAGSESPDWLGFSNKLWERRGGALGVKMPHSLLPPPPPPFPWLKQIN